ncbi:phosphatidate phosphatase APP1 [Crossiella equi]|uniref:Phosphatidate phosphatase APP1 n=2 Tax=Crossiella equi TaxID=130796 RepID=A0ABS5AG67_9PSEU|nr:SdrD B-like domain-containing protein [Crossiella equi]MBP2475567.1 phosphatidate phosphatase APP1 [Crossiella equi]
MTVTDPSGGSASATTGADGTVTVALGNVTGGKYRVEATIPESMPYLKPAPAGGGLSSLTEFVDVSGGKNVDVTMGLWNPADYCQSSPTLATACQRDLVTFTNDPGHRSVVTYPWTSRGKTAPTERSDQGKTGTVFGLAYQASKKRIFAGAFAKRLTQYGPAGAGGIYAVAADGSSTTTFATVPNAGSTAHKLTENADGAFYGVPGKQSLGDLDLSEDGTELYVVNLNDKKLYVYDATGATASAPKGSYTIPDPGCPAAGDWRPGALGVRDGVVYVGGVCTGQSTKEISDIRASVRTFKAGTFGPVVLNKQLNFPRGDVDMKTTTWFPWIDKFFIEPYNDPDDPDNMYMADSTAWLSDIEIEKNGDLVLGFRDRSGDQGGARIPSADGSFPDKVFTYSLSGDLNRACKQADGSFVWEGSGNCKNNRPSEPIGGGEPDSVKEYYPGEYYAYPDGRVQHLETSLGSSALVLGESRMPVNVMDPIELFTSGTGWFDRNNGQMQNPQHSNSYEISTLETEGFGKANGLGDLEALCDLAPVQIGNRVWFDGDGDGVQDGDEKPVPGVKVTLMACGSTAALATKTTDAKGQYYFGAADGAKADSCYTLKFDYTGADTSGLPGAPPAATLRWTGKEAGSSRTADSNVDPATGQATVNVGANGSDDHTIDAGLVGSPPNKLGDLVWVDTNKNGVQDANEPGVPGVKVTAKTAAGATAGTATTDANGKYLITPLADGAYTVCFDLSGAPAQYQGYLPTRPNAGGDDAKDSDPDPATGCTASTTLGPDKREDLTLDAGIRPGNRLGDYVWIDTNKDGVQDAGETPVQGVPVTLKDGSGATVGTTTTGPDGKYLFAPLKDGTYQVCFDLKSLPANVGDYVPTKANASSDDAKDSDADPATGCTAPTTLNIDKPEDLTLDAGLVPPVNQLGDYVWIDTNKNGQQDAPEPGVEGVKVTLLKGDGTQAGTTTTDKGGKYLFTDLPDGSYQVCFDLKNLPAAVGDYALTSNNTGADETDSDADPVTGCTPVVQLGQGKRQNLTLDAGLVSPPNKLGDYVWIDANKNGLQDTDEKPVPGVTVVVKDATGATVGTTTTGADGKYLFDQLPDGKFSVCFSLGNLPQAVADYVPTKQYAGDDTKDSDADPATGCTEPVDLGPGKRQNLTLDLGLQQPVNRLGDYVWVDANKNGQQDAAEKPVPGVKAVLQTADGTVVGSTTTNEQGKYLFEDLPDGSYKVCFDTKNLPSTVGDYTLTSVNTGSDETDSDADPTTGCTPVVALGPGKRQNLSLDAGLVSPPNKLGDYVWVDANKNGVQDTDEKPVPGVTVVVKDATGTTVGSTTTNESGKYLFDQLPDGSFTVCFDLAKLPATVGDYQVTKQNGGASDKDSDADPATGCTKPVELGPGKREDLTVDAGLVAPVNQLGDYVWVDTNKNGQQDTNEQPVPGVKAVLQTADGTKVAETTTDEQGKYLFTDLPDGSYQVCFDTKNLPSTVGDFTLTTPKTGAATTDSDADPTTGCTPVVALGPGKRQDLSLDAGLVQPVNRLGDYVWVDTNRDGVQDPDEKPVPGVTVKATTKSGETVTTKTNEQGKYLFEDLPNGLYQVCFDLTTLPAEYAGYLPTRPNAGSDDAKDSDPEFGGCTNPVELTVGKRENLTVDLGIRPPNKLGDYVWVDANRNGVQDADEKPVAGVSAVLKNAEGKELGTTKTDEAGKYLFDKLPDGAYTVCFDGKSLPAPYGDYQVTKPNAGTADKDSDVDPATWCTKPTTLGVDSPEDLTLDAGIAPPVNRLGDYVWVDKNGNGLQDDGEPGVEGVPVKVVDKDGKTVTETTSGKDGKYLVEGLPDGTYTVCFGLKNLPSALSGYTPTKAGAGDAAKDSDADPATGCSKPVELGAGKRENLTVDAGLLAPAPQPGGEDPWTGTSGDGKLADTGADVAWLIALGALALGGGAALMLLAGRRRRSNDA